VGVVLVGGLLVATDDSRDAWTVVFDDGCEVECDAAHLWLTVSSYDYFEPSPLVRSTLTIGDELFDTAFGIYSHKVPVAGSASFRPITGVIPVESSPMRNIEVDSPDGSFLCGPGVIITRH
jgi:hypothetical protein